MYLEHTTTHEERKQRRKKIVYSCSFRKKNCFSGKMCARSREETQNNPMDLLTLILLTAIAKNCCSIKVDGGGGTA